MNRLDLQIGRPSVTSISYDDYTPLRFKQPQTIENGSVDLDHLVDLSNIFKTASLRSQFRNGESVSTFVPLVLERLVGLYWQPKIET